MNLTGGGSRSALWRQILADVLGLLVTHRDHDHDHARRWARRSRRAWARVCSGPGTPSPGFRHMLADLPAFELTA